MKHVFLPCKVVAAFMEVVPDAPEEVPYFGVRKDVSELTTVLDELLALGVDFEDTATFALRLLFSCEDPGPLDLRPRHKENRNRHRADGNARSNPAQSTMERKRSPRQHPSEPTFAELLLYLGLVSRLAKVTEAATGLFVPGIAIEDVEPEAERILGFVAPDMYGCKTEQSVGVIGG